jgi:hypothetical protein
MRVFKRLNYLQIDFSDGSTYSTDECTEEMWHFLEGHQDDEEAIKEMILGETLYQGKMLMDKVKNSKILTLRGNSVYMLGVSELSIPEDFVSKIIEAEEKGNEEELRKFKNFWTLVSLNPDSRVRNNLFWFIRKWDMQITESGLIIAYRNADIKEEAKYSTDQVKTIINLYYKEKYINHNDPYSISIIVETKSGKALNMSIGAVYDEIVNGGDSPIYTDQHSHTTEIKLGNPVSIPRDECDADQEHSCSRGLHCGAKGWLKRNYYGTVGLMVLVNPANVVAVPTIDSYGKMRTCEYFPIAIIDFDENGDIIEKSYSLHDDVAYLKELKYEGTINNVDADGYEIGHTGLNRESMYEHILASLNGIE